MNTIQIQLDDSQYETLIESLEGHIETLHSDRKHADSDEGEKEISEEIIFVMSMRDDIRSSKSYLWTSGSGTMELDIPTEVVDSIAQSGDNEPAVLEVLETPSYLRKQLENLPMDQMNEHLLDAGIDTEGFTGKKMVMYVLWLACFDIKDEAVMS